MKLEDALKLKKGTIVQSNTDCIAPEKFTKGKNYVMQEDAKPLYRNGWTASSTRFRPEDTPCNAVLPVIDDEGRLKYAVYIAFKVV